MQNSIDYKNQSYLIAHCAIYYGNSFETELDDLDYQYFDENTISINTSVYPFYRLPLIQNFYLNNLKLVDLERQKIDLKQFISTIYKINHQINWVKFYQIISQGSMNPLLIQRSI